MEAPRLSRDNAVLAYQRRAERHITAGLEDEIARLHSLNALQRCRECSFFVVLYAIGALIAHYSDQLLAASTMGILCMGIALNALGILIHDGLHGLLAGRPWVNHLLSFLVGLPLGISATAYQVTHTNHHYDLGRKLDYGTYRQHLKSPRLLWTAYFLQLFLGTLLYVLFIPFLAFKAASGRSRVFIIVEYSVIVAVFVVVARNTELDSLLLYWGYPLIVMSALTNVRGLASHALGDAENIYLSSRTIRGSKLVDVLFLHENYHLEHHLFPRVPSYNLSKVHALIWERLPEALYSQSYIRFLLGFLSAAFRNDLRPLGVVRPVQD